MGNSPTSGSLSQDVCSLCIETDILLSISLSCQSACPSDAPIGNLRKDIIDALKSGYIPNTKYTKDFKITSSNGKILAYGSLYDSRDQQWVKIDGFYDPSLDELDYTTDFQGKNIHNINADGGSRISIVYYFFYF